MRLDFNVLWVDDQPKRVEAQISSIKREMEAEGFNFNPTHCLSIEDVKNRIAQDVFNDEVDLILVDWDLGDNLKGQKVIREIRDRIQYKDVVFYSAQTPPETLRTLAYDEGLEGVYCAERDSLRDEVIGVFESLVKKVLDLDHTRGIVMGSTCDIDQMVVECITTAHPKLESDEQNKLVEDALDAIATRLRQHAAQLEKLRATPDIATLLSDKTLFSANDRLRALSRILTTRNFNQTEMKKHVTTYIKEVVPKRNSLGHRVILPGGAESVIAMEGAETMTLQDLRELRRLILNLRGEFRTILEAMKT